MNDPLTTETAGPAPQAGQCAIYHLSALQVTNSLMQARQWALPAYRLEAPCTTPETLIARLAETLHFPDWFGQNLDALADALSNELPVEAQGAGYVLQLPAEAFSALQDDLREVVEQHLAESAAQGKTVWWLVTDHALGADL